MSVPNKPDTGMTTLQAISFLVLRCVAIIYSVDPIRPCRIARQSFLLLDENLATHFLRYLGSEA
jgi:hypothetical protein